MENDADHVANRNASGTSHTSRSEVFPTHDSKPGFRDQVSSLPEMGELRADVAEMAHRAAYMVGIPQTIRPKCTEAAIRRALSAISRRPMLYYVKQDLANFLYDTFNRLLVEEYFDLEFVRNSLQDLNGIDADHTSDERVVNALFRVEVARLIRAGLHAHGLSHDVIDELAASGRPAATKRLVEEAMANGVALSLDAARKRIERACKSVESSLLAHRSSALGSIATI